jgi:hypothetical protein
MAVTVGGGAVTVPPVVIVPVPEMVMVTAPAALTDSEPASEGNDPVSPA